MARSKSFYLNDDKYRIIFFNNIKFKISLSIANNYFITISIKICYNGGDINERNRYKTFEDIKHIDENGVEFWYARELQIVLDYKEWRKFEGEIEKAKLACQNSSVNVFEHFVGADKLSKRANNAEVKINDYKLSRYACYLIAQNGDSRKKVIAKNGGTMPEDLPTPKKA